MVVLLLVVWRVHVVLVVGLPVVRSTVLQHWVVATHKTSASCCWRAEATEVWGCIRGLLLVQVLLLLCAGVPRQRAVGVVVLLVVKLRLRHCCADRPGTPGVARWTATALHL